MKFKPMFLSVGTYKELRGCFTRSYAEMFVQEGSNPAHESFKFGGVEFVRYKDKLPRIEWVVEPIEEYLGEGKAIAASVRVLEVPHDLIQKAEEVSLWFAQRGIDDWELGGIQSRRYDESIFGLGGRRKLRLPVSVWYLRLQR